MIGNYKIIIVGFGVVGKLEYTILEEKFLPDILDPKIACLIDGHIIDPKPAFEKVKYIKYDLAIVAVPTPYDKESGVLDCHLVYDAVKEVNAKIYLIKSTVNVGYCDYLAAQTGKHIIHSPEYSGATQHCTNFEYNYTILGGDKKDCQFVQQVYQEVFDARHVFEFVDHRTSELTKLTANAWLATKVSFFNSIWEYCQKLDIPFEEVRKCIVLDPRINPAHTFVYDKHPYWDSHCFNKDVPALANMSDNPILKEVVRYNAEMKKMYKNN